jgi:hypothetical protein
MLYAGSHFMGGSKQPTFRIFLMVLAVANMAALGARLWPWTEALGLPGGLVPVVDLTAICLGYVCVAWWLGGYERGGKIHQALPVAVFPGLMAGIALIAEVLFRMDQTAEDPAAPLSQMNWVLLATACVLWALAGFLGRRATQSGGVAILSGLWSGMIAGQLACGTVLIASFFAAPPPVSNDPWKQYESLAVVNPILGAVAHNIEMATAFALLSPLVAAALGCIFGVLGRSREPEEGPLEPKTEPAETSLPKE